MNFQQMQDEFKACLMFANVDPDYLVDLESKTERIECDTPIDVRYEVFFKLYHVWLRDCANKSPDGHIYPFKWWLSDVLAHINEWSLKNADEDLYYE